MTIAARDMGLAPAAAETPKARGWGTAALSLCALLSALATSSVNIALPVLQGDFQAAFPDVQWVVLAYLLAITALVIVAGRMGDMVGRRRVLLGGVSLFTIGSALCAMAPSLAWLLAARALQGIGAAAMMALTLALASETVGRERAGRALGLLASMSAIGTALGPSCGGLLIAAFGWPAVFWLNVPLGVLTFALAMRGLPAGQGANRASLRNLDATGALLLAATLVAYTLAMTLGWAPSDAFNAALLVAAGTGFWLFLRAQGRAASPLLDLGVMRDARLRASLAMSALVSTVMMATLVVGPFYLSGALRLAPTAAGLVLSVGPLTVALAGIPAGRFADRFGPYRVALAGLGAMAVGCALLALLPAGVGVAGYVIAIVVITTGYALFLTANNMAAMSGIAPDRRGVVSGLLNLSRNLGLATGASAMGTLFAVFVGGEEIAGAPAEAISLGLRGVFAVAGGLALAAFALCLRVFQTPR